MYDDLKTKWDKLNAYGKRMGLDHESEDYASWSLIQFLEGKKLSDDQLYIEYLYRVKNDYLDIGIELLEKLG